MPIYEYRCAKCGGEFEELTSLSSREAVSCHACGSRRVARLLSAFAVQADTQTAMVPETGPCGSCGAPRRGMCGE